MGNHTRFVRVSKAIKKLAEAENCPAAARVAESCLLRTTGADLDCPIGELLAFDMLKGGENPAAAEPTSEDWKLAEKVWKDSGDTLEGCRSHVLSDVRCPMKGTRMCLGTALFPSDSPKP